MALSTPPSAVEAVVQAVELPATETAGIRRLAEDVDEKGNDDLPVAIFSKLHLRLCIRFMQVLLLFSIYFCLFAERDAGLFAIAFISAIASD